MATRTQHYDNVPQALRERLHVAMRRGYLDDYTEEWQYTFAGEFLRKYPARVKTLDVLREQLGRVPRWSDLTDRNLRRWKDELSQKLCRNTLSVRLAEISSAISARTDGTEVPAQNYRRILSARSEPSTAVYLTEDEVTEMDRYTPANEEEEYVRRIFMRGCYTLARHSDCVRFTEANIIGGNFIYTSQKTKTTTTLPVHRNLKKYLGGGAVPLWDYQFNAILRGMCKKVGIDAATTAFRRGREETLPKYEFVASHTARRSGATNLYLRGADILTISRLLGHSNVLTTQRYIVGYRPLSQAAAAFFNQ